VADDTAPLRDVVHARRFLLASQELPWLIKRIKRQCVHDLSGDTYADVRNDLVTAVADVGAQLCLELHWQPLQFAQEQAFGEETQTESCWLSRMIVYCGNTTTCYATTLSEYASRVWPDYAERTVACIQNALNTWRDQDTGERTTKVFDALGISIAIDDSTMTVRLLEGGELVGAEARIRALEVSYLKVLMHIRS